MPSGLDVHEWNGIGYRPLVFSDNWQVAILNWEPAFDPTNLGEIERHIDTDEVFVLIRGRAVLFTWTNEGEFASADMALGAIHNVLAGTWHGLLAGRDASWVIVEKRDTHLNDTHLCRITEEKRRELQARFPAWLLGPGPDVEAHSSHCQGDSQP